MLTEDQKKYIAQFFQIGGFCCMIPFEKFVLNIGELKLSDLSFIPVVYFVISIALFFFGIILEVKGLEYLEERRSKWIH